MIKVQLIRQSREVHEHEMEHCSGKNKEVPDLMKSELTGDRIGFLEIIPSGSQARLWPFLLIEM